MRRIVAVAALLLLLPSAAAQIPSTDYDWPQYDEVRGAMDAASASDWVQLHVIGQSVEGRQLVMLEITDPGSTVPREERVVTLITTQQHGNEPAGTPAALRLLEDILAGAPIAQTLSDQVLLLWPLANPDGAGAASGPTRANAHGTDLNRDHVHLEEPEVQALHGLLNAWDVHVGMDHHEYSGSGIGYPSPVRLYDFDITALYPRHGNVREPTQAAAVEIMYDAIWPALDEAGYSRGEYGTQTAADFDVQHLAGGPDPGILRNNFGLNNVAGLLIESFVPTTPNPLHSAERRIDAHRVVMDATLEFAHANGDELIAAKRASERLNVERPLSEYIEEWPDDPVTGMPNEGNIRAPLAPGYRTTDDLGALMMLHGLPAGIPDGASTVYAVANERGGLIAAILHPASSRSVPSSVEAVESLPDLAQSDTPAEAEPSPAPLAILLVGLFALALAARRQRA